MEVMSSSSTSRLGRSTSNSAMELLYNKKYRDQRSETSPERTKVWTEPPNSIRKVPVVYYLSRNGQLEHPHFIEVPLSSSSDGLYLRDVIKRLNSLRGKAMGSMYSWSSKRSYKNGFVWNDLSENDFIYPTHGHEYVLKGSEILDGPKFDESVDSTSKHPPPPETSRSSGDTDFPVVTRRRNQSWSSIDLNEYKVVYKTESSGELAGRAAADASTQTEDKRRRRRVMNEIEEKSGKSNKQNVSTELSRDEISPPPSESSPEKLESLLKCEGKEITKSDGEMRNDLTVNNQPSGRMKASTVLMQLLTCGSISFKHCEDHSDLSLMSHEKAELPRAGQGKNQVEKDAGESLVENKNVFGNGIKVKLKGMVDKEYFSGSLLQETNKEQIPSLKRSNSYNADRG